MITFEFNSNTGTHQFTNALLATITLLMGKHGWGLNYDIIEHDHWPNRFWLWVHHAEGNPTRIWIDLNGEITLEEEVTWNWKGTS